MNQMVPGGMTAAGADYMGFSGWVAGRPVGPAMPRPYGSFASGSFGPFFPMWPMPIDQPPEGGDGRPMPRRFQYPVGWNLPIGQPGNEGLTLATFQMLRSLTDRYSTLGAMINMRVKELAGLDWDIGPTKDAAEKARKDKGYGKDLTDRAAQIKRWFLWNIDSNYWGFQRWFTAVLWDQYVIDAVAIHLLPTKVKGKGLFGSGVAEMEALDASTIRPLLDIRGALPRPPEVAFQQYLWGVARVDLMQVLALGEEADAEAQKLVEAAGIETNLDAVEPDGEFRADQLLYLKQLGRTFTPYGLSPVAQALLPIAIGIQRQVWLNDYFAEGTIPGVYVVAGPQYATTTQQKQLQDNLNALAGDIAWKHRVIVLPPGSETKPQKDLSFAKDVDLAINEMLMPVLQIQPQEIGQVPGGRTSGLGGSSASKEMMDSAERKRTKPDAKLWKETVFDWMIQSAMRQFDLEWKWLAFEDEVDEVQKAQADSIRLHDGQATIDQLVIERGGDPFNLPMTQSPMIWASQVIPLDTDKVPEVPQPVMGQPAKPSPFGGGGDGAQPGADPAAAGAAPPPPMTRPVPGKPGKPGKPGPDGKPVPAAANGKKPKKPGKNGAKPLPGAQAPAKPPKADVHIHINDGAVATPPKAKSAGLAKDYTSVDRDSHGRWTSGGGDSTSTDTGSVGPGAQHAIDELRAGRSPDISPKDVGDLMHAGLTLEGPPLDLDTVKVEGTRQFGQDGFHILRVNMPQIGSKDRPAFLDDLRKAGITVTEKAVKPQMLQPSQNQISLSRTARIWQALRDGSLTSTTIMSSRDGYVLDGHHRWAAYVAQSFDDPSTSLRTVEIGMDGKPLIAWANKWADDHGLEHHAMVAQVGRDWFEVSLPGGWWAGLDGKDVTAALIKGKGRVKYKGDLHDIVFQYLLRSYPKKDVEWVLDKDIDWEYEPKVGLDQINMARRPGGRDPEKVEDIGDTLDDGASMDPIVLVDPKTPTSTGKYGIADGWHRTLGAEKAGQDHVPAFIGRHVPDKYKYLWMDDMQASSDSVKGKVAELFALRRYLKAGKNIDDFTPHALTDREMLAVKLGVAKGGYEALPAFPNEMADLVKDISVETGLVPYDLQPGAVGIYPHDAPHPTSCPECHADLVGDRCPNGHVALVAIDDVKTVSPAIAKMRDALADFVTDELAVVQPRQPEGGMRVARAAGFLEQMAQEERERDERQLAATRESGAMLAGALAKMAEAIGRPVEPPVVHFEPTINVEPTVIPQGAVQVTVEVPGQRPMQRLVRRDKVTKMVSATLDVPIGDPIPDGWEA